MPIQPREKENNTLEIPDPSSKKKKSKKSCEKKDRNVKGLAKASTNRRNKPNHNKSYKNSPKKNMNLLIAHRTRLKNTNRTPSSAVDKKKTNHSKTNSVVEKSKIQEDKRNRSFSKFVPSTEKSKDKFTKSETKIKQKLSIKNKERRFSSKRNTTDKQKEIKIDQFFNSSALVSKVERLTLFRDSQSSNNSNHKIRRREKKENRKHKCCFMNEHDLTNKKKHSKYRESNSCSKSIQSTKTEQTPLSSKSKRK